MHPDLSPHIHDLCKPAIEALHTCHREHPMGKFFGSCNALKAALDECLYQEYLVLRRKNHEKGTKRRQAYERRLKENE